VSCAVTTTFTEVGLGATACCASNGVRAEESPDTRPEAASDTRTGNPPTTVAEAAPDTARPDAADGNTAADVEVTAAESVSAESVARAFPAAETGTDRCRDPGEGCP
jgi:hypothetical protein